MFTTGFIVAGGEGKRLRPLTDEIPKPLLPIGEKPIIQTIVERMREYGILTIYISINYKKQMVKNYLRDGSRYGVKIHYIEEENKTGTVGSLGMLPLSENNPILLSNGDLVTDINYGDIYRELKKNDFVVSAVEKVIPVDYGVLKINEQMELSDWEEKPQIKMYVNAGVYGISEKALSLIKEKLVGSNYMDMPTLWSFFRKSNLRTFVYVHKGIWHDVGRMEDYLALSRNGEEKI
jgi:NDP-sugar pyrophosphorylase family protein